MPLNIDWQQILLHAFNLVLLFTILYFLLYKPCKKFMDGRAQYYKDLDEKAKNTVEEGKLLQKTYEEKLQNAEKEAAALRVKAQKEADAAGERVLDEAKTAAAAILETAKAEAAREQSRMVAEAQKEISEMVSDATAKIVFPDTKSAYDSFLNEVEGCEHHDDKR